MPLPAALLTPAQVIMLAARILKLPPSVPPPEVLMKVNRLMSKFENQVAPLSLPLFGATHGEMSMEKMSLGRCFFMAPTNWLMICPASAGDHGCVWLVPVYW